MRTSAFGWVFAVVFQLSLWGQVTTSHSGGAYGMASTDGGMAGATGPGPVKMLVQHEMGKWWQNSEIAKKLQLNDGQIKQLNQIFFEHRLKLIDYEADTQKQDLKLQTLLDADQTDISQVGGQVDQLLAARGKLEREFTFMNLDLRKVLTLDQWRQLKTIREERGPENVFFYRRTMGFGGAGGPMPPPPPLPPGSPDDRE